MAHSQVRVLGTHGDAIRASCEKGKKMAWKDWDDRDYWADDSKCIVCKASMDKSQDLVCSATCEDIFELRGQSNSCYS